MKEKFSLIYRQFNWRMLLMRIVMYALLFNLVVLLTPKMYYNDKRLIVALIVSIGFGVISALLRPIIQFITLPFLFATYGLVLVFINVVLLLVTDRFFSNALEVEGLLYAIIGGVWLGLLSGLIESLLGLTAPIVPDSEEELRKRITFQDRGMVYAMFQAAPAELQRYAPVAGSLAAPLPSRPDTQDVQAVLDALDATAAQPEAITAAEAEPPPPRRRRAARKRTPDAGDEEAAA